ncbi:MAG: hypothetical protein SGPRY_012046 [Prymnesium sp.]
MCVACLRGETELARSELQATRDPLFSQPLQLWGEAAGKGKALALSLAVLSEDGATLAVAQVERGLIDRCCSHGGWIDRILIDGRGARDLD